MFREMIDLLKIKDERPEKNGWIAWQKNITAQDFLDDLIDFFELSDIRKMYDSDSKEEFSITPNNYISQQSKELLYIQYILEKIKPFIPLAFKMSQKYMLEEKIKEINLSDDSIINIINNFLSLKRTGRKEVFSKREKKEFEEFKEKYSKIIKYYIKTKAFDGIDSGSILDHAKTLKEYDITKKQLQSYLNDFRYFKRDCSKATKYRFDRHYVFIEKSIFSIKYSLKNYDFWLKSLEDYGKFKIDKK